MPFGGHHLIKDAEINYRIRDREVRVLDTDGSQLGVMSGRDAYSLAQRKGLDLVKISPGANPPVCKILDYGKFKFDQKKRDKELKKAQTVSELKEVWLSMTIEQHDLETKAKHARKFLTVGSKVKVLIRMRGRQQAHAKLGIGVMNDFYAIVEDVSMQDKIPAVEGRSIVMILSPKKNVGQSQEKVKPTEAKDKPATQALQSKPMAQPLTKPVMPSQNKSAQQATKAKQTTLSKDKQSAQVKPQTTKK